MSFNLWDSIRWFKESEFDSKDLKGSGSMMSPKVVFMLDAMRAIMGARFGIESGYRTKEHNAKVYGAPNSAHLTGEAVDVRTVGWTKEQRIYFMQLARTLGFNGVGVAKNYIHIDIKPRVASWRYNGHETIALRVGDEVQYA